MCAVGVGSCDRSQLLRVRRTDIDRDSMGNGGSKVTNEDKAILDLKIQRDKIQQYQKRILVVLEREHEVARECLANGDKRRALLALRKRKYQEQLLTKTDKQLETLEELTQNIEFALVQKDVMYGLQQGNEVLKTINKEMSLDKVERIMDESAEAVAYQNEVSEMLAGQITNSEEAEVQEELEALERQELEKQANFPKVPTQKLPQEPEQQQQQQEPVQNEEQEEPAKPLPA